MSTSLEISWKLKSFNDLSNEELYQILQLRITVFIIEQQCFYQDADNKDQQSMHLCGWHNKQIIAYCRILPAGISFTESSIGRVITDNNYRGSGIGLALVEKAIKECSTLFGRPIRIGAQEHLQHFYEQMGFKKDSERYLEDGIPHIEMILKQV